MNTTRKILMAGLVGLMAIGAGTGFGFRYIDKRVKTVRKKANGFGMIRKMAFMGLGGFSGTSVAMMAGQQLMQMKKK